MSMEKYLYANINIVNYLVFSEGVDGEGLQTHSKSIQLPAQ